jgi:alanine racemase
MIPYILTKLRLLRTKYSPSINITINSKAVIHNLNEFRKISPKTQIAPVLKSNAYGHGITLIAKILEKESIPFLIVDSYFEAITLRSNGVKHKILIIGFTPIHTITSNKLPNISFTITSLKAVEDLVLKTKKTIDIQIKIDTGMHRQGIEIGNFIYALDILKKNNNINIEGIISHFADADNHDPSFTEKQILAWNNIVETGLKEIPSLKYYHISATAGTYYHSKIKANVSRLGIGLYGIKTNAMIDKLVKINPVMRIETKISNVTEVNKGEGIGYGCTEIAKSNIQIATIPIGYSEGIDRRLSSTGYVKIGNSFAPIIGQVSMNICTINVSNIKEVKIGTPVEVVSDKTEDLNSIYQISKTCKTIPYEILVHINPHLHREVI